MGFTDVDADGYIDTLYPSPRHSRQGVARSLLSVAEARARRLGADHLWANVSIAARPIFESHGFYVQAEQHPVRGGMRMTNFRMTRPITTSG
ncbi:MAG: GNAT family N-acetyltransferase [Ornithinimicrobium sp.]